LQTASSSHLIVKDTAHSRLEGMILWLQLHCIRNDRINFLLRLVTERDLLINWLMFKTSICIGKAFHCLYRPQNSPYFEACKFISNLGYYYYYYYGSTALCWALAAFQFLDPTHSRYDSLDGGSARCKASTTYTQNNTE
jgi:hypothetical protein